MAVSFVLTHNELFYGPFSPVTETSSHPHTRFAKVSYKIFNRRYWRYTPFNRTYDQNLRSQTDKLIIMEVKEHAMGQSIFDNVCKSKVIQNYTKLTTHYVPEQLIARDEQLIALQNYHSNSQNTTVSQNIFVYGGPGQGKTGRMRINLTT